LAVSFVTALFYLPGLDGAFLNWDDVNNFVQNPNYRGFSAHTLGWMLTTRLMGHYHPLTWFTLAFDYELWGMNPVGYHLTSLLFHAASAGLLYTLLKQLFESAPAAAIGALFWSLHPLRVESVSWITERRDVVCGVFFLLSVLAYLRMCREQAAGGRAGRWLALSVAAYAASLLSKSLGILLPLALLVLDVYPLRRFTPGNRRRVLLEKLPYGALAGAILLVMILAMKELGQVRTTVDPLARAAQASFGVCLYVWKTLLPWNLSPLYPIGSGINPAEAKFVACMIAAPLLSAVLVLLAWKKRPAPLAAWVAFLVLAAPVLGAVVRGFQLAADRYTYLSALPFSVLLAGALRTPLQGPSGRVGRGVAAAILLLLGILTSFQTRIWHTDMALWNHAIASGWGGAVAFTNRGSEKFRAVDLAGARADFDEAIRLDPRHSLAYLNRGKIFEMSRDRERALEEYSRAIECELRSPDAYERRSFVRDQKGDLAGARADLDEAIRRFPEAAAPWVTRGKLKLRSGDIPGGLADLEEGLRRNPRDASAYHYRGKVRFTRGDHDGAWRDFSAAIGLDPKLPEAHQDRGTVMALRGKFDLAVMDFSDEIRIDPRSLDAWRYRGLARMKMGARADATADLEQLLRLAPPDWPGRPEVEGWLADLRRPRR
jgi:tetratricopeptide (TPR) repeat protein